MYTRGWADMQHICAGPSLPFVCGREGQADSPDIPWNTMYRIWLGESLEYGRQVACKLRVSGVYPAQSPEVISCACRSGLTRPGDWMWDPGYSRRCHEVTKREG